MSKTLRFAVVGCGLMGKEFAGAAARWGTLTVDAMRPEIVAVADPSEPARKWFEENVPTVKHSVADYKELLKIDEIDAVYVAVPHILHEQVYIDILRAGKHMLGEKPFGMDKAQNDKIVQEVKAHPELFVRCASEFPYYPACQEVVRWVREGKLGRIIEMKSGFLHSSDLDLNKKINWKRKVEINGEYGCLGDLGIHTQHVPFHLGFVPKSVYAQLSKFVKERPDGQGGMAPCDTWDNATMNTIVEIDGLDVPMTIETKRMSPGSTNEWYLEIYGLEASVKFSTNDPNAFMFTQAVGKEQAWCRLDIGYKPIYPTITGSIFEFGFTDSMLQMWAAFMLEFEGRDVPFGCFTVEETAMSHALQTAALESHKKGAKVQIQY